MAELQAWGFEVWIDTRRIIPGKQWSTEIATAIAQCDFFLLFVSSSSVKSDGVRREVDLAHKQEKMIIPVMLEEVNIPVEWDYPLAGIQWIEIRKPDWKSWLLIALSDRTIASAEVSNTAMNKSVPDPAIDRQRERILGRIEKANQLIDEYENIILMSEDPKEKMRAKQSISDTEALIMKYRAQLATLKSD